jgi:heme/copper-type cytochrome/quinol oxidase subunit 1
MRKTDSGGSIVTFSLVILMALILAPLLVQLRNWAPAALFFAVAVVYLLFGAVHWVQMQIAFNQAHEAATAHQDTYYVVGQGHDLMNLGVAMAMFGVITWLQTYFGAMRYPAMTRVLFWVLHIGLILGSDCSHDFCLNHADTSTIPPTWKPMV